MKKSAVFIWLGLLLVVVLLYARLMDATSLTWDDDTNIFANPYFTMNFWLGLWSEAYYGLYVPLTSTLWAGLYYWGQAAAWPFHALNVLLHLANISLLFVVLRHLGRRWDLSSPYALALALGLFALHPMQVESVAWISGTRDLLSTFFALLTVLIYFQAPRWRNYILATMCFFCALLSKPNVVVLPVVIGVLEVWLNGQRRWWLKMLPWLLLSGLITMITHGAQVDHFEDTVDWWYRPLLMCDSYFFYLRKLLWPFALAANYDRRPEVILAEPERLWLAAAFGVIFLGVLLWTWRKDRRWFALAVAAVLLLLPSSGIVPFGFEAISDVADHYMYLPLAALAGLALFAQRWRVLPVILLPVWAWGTYQRIPVWHDNPAFFTAMSEATPDSYSTAIGMSVVLCQDLKQYDKGVEWTEKALARHSHDLLALANKAYCLLHAGQIDRVIAMQDELDDLDRPVLAANQAKAYSSLMATLGGRQRDSKLNVLPG